MLLMLRSKWSILLTPVQRYASEPAELLSDALPDAHSLWRPMSAFPCGGRFIEASWRIIQHRVIIGSSHRGHVELCEEAKLLSKQPSSRSFNQRPCRERQYS